MALSRKTRRQLASPAGRLLLVASGLLLLNMVTLTVLYLLPLPDADTLPGRQPEHDIVQGQP